MQKMSASLLLPHMRQVALIPRAFTCHTLAQLAGGSQACLLPITLRSTVSSQPF